MSRVEREIELYRAERRAACNRELARRMALGETTEELLLSFRNLSNTLFGEMQTGARANSEKSSNFIEIFS